MLLQQNGISVGGVYNIRLEDVTCGATKLVGWPHSFGYQSTNGRCIFNSGAGGRLAACYVTLLPLAACIQGLLATVNSLLICESFGSVGSRQLNLAGLTCRQLGARHNAHPSSWVSPACHHQRMCKAQLVQPDGLYWEIWMD